MPPKSKTASVSASPAVASLDPALPIQRNTDVATEMADVAPAKPKAAPKSRKPKTQAVTAVPESIVAVQEPVSTVLDEVTDVVEAVEAKASAIRFCPTCRYYLFLQSGSNTLQRLCRNCGYTETDEKGGLVMEQSSETSEGYKILVNEFTRYDVRLPHIVKTLRCPEPTCKTNHNEGESDILYIKYNPTDLKYLYICTSCGFQWTSRR
jgi:DNA-directed RNA polymerase subunit M/transcription elongation factor TFIIS